MNVKGVDLSKHNGNIKIEDFKKAGYELVTPIIITNSQQFMDIIVKKKDVVTANDQVLAII